jgi:rhamnulokinase
MTSSHLAIDLGASSGRAILGVLEHAPQRSAGSAKVLRLEELHRFVHLGQPTPTGPVWNLTDIWRNILDGMKKAAIYCQANDLQLTSVGVDCWGVDWALLGESGELLALPHCYRDPQNEEVLDRVLDQLGGPDWLYERTGIQLMGINTLFQVAARFEREPKLFEAASHFVFMPDLFHYWLSGEIAVERTIASTSSLLNVQTGDWDVEILQRLGIPAHLFGRIIEPGTKLGTVREELVGTTGAPKGLVVVAPASHDTASAIAAVPVESGTDWAYLSSGTWSLMGAELSHPNTSPAAAAVPFTNERGVDGTVRFLKNITGLWMVQELRRESAEGVAEPLSFVELMELAAVSPSFQTVVNVNESEFLQPGEMASKIRAYAERTGQPIPESLGELIRCSLESLALCYRETLMGLEQVLDRKFQTLYVVGGGSQNQLLNRFIADALDRRIVCGPAEATAIGNVLVQAIGCGDVEDLAELRKIVRCSFDPLVVLPTDQATEWREVDVR